MFYAQLDINNICIGVSILSGEVPEYNYGTEVDFNPVTNEKTEKQVFISRMIKIEVPSNSYIGLHYNEDGTWNEVIAE